MTNTLKTIPTHELPDFLNKESLEELIADRESYLDDVSDVEGVTDRDDVKADIATIQAFIDEMEDSNCDDWGASGLIRDGLPFSDYIRETIEDCEGESLKNLPWYIKDAIDWDQVSDTCLSDYTDYSFGGLTYWGR